MDQLFDWVMKRNSPVAEEINRHFEEQMQEYERQVAEKEKSKKGKKKGKEEEPELNPDDFKKLTVEILSKMVAERVAQEDCNAGVIFDNLTSQYWADLKFAIEAISEALPKQNLQVLLMRF